MHNPAMRARGNGTKRSDGRWQTCIRIKGHPKPVWVIEDSQRTMQDEVRRLRKEGVTSRESVQSAYEQWIQLKTAKCEPKTIRAYKQSMAPALEAFGKKKLALLEPNHIETLCIELGNTRRSEMTREVLRNFLRWCQKQKWVQSNAAEDSDPVKVDKKPKPKLGQKAFAGIMEYADNLTVELFVLVLMETGLRPYRECAPALKSQLQADDIGWWFNVPDSKTDSGIRRVPITHEIYEAMMTLAPESELIFPTFTGAPWSERNILRAWHRWQLKWIMAEGLDPDRALYDLYSVRHLFATRAARKVRDKVLQLIMGHSDIRTTRMFYDQPEDVELQELLN